MHEKHGHGLFTCCQALSGSAQDSACQRDTRLTHRPLVTPVTTHAAGEGFKAKLQVTGATRDLAVSSPTPTRLSASPITRSTCACSLQPLKAVEFLGGEIRSWSAVVSDITGELGLRVEAGG